MSADRWSVCPRCHAKRVKAIAKSAEKVDKSYGNVSVSAFDGLRAEHERMANAPEECTLREDWELGMGTEGEFTIDYRCSCECGFRFGFKEARMA